jgi:hypothetical protein
VDSAGLRASTASFPGRWRIDQLVFGGTEPSCGGASFDCRSSTRAMTMSGCSACVWRGTPANGVRGMRGHPRSWADREVGDSLTLPDHKRPSSGG